MKLGKCSLTNFASYKQLDFDFEDLGLALIHGETGSGKSTLQDAPAWVLFGTTAKNGNADEIRPWNKTNELTKGTIHVQLQSGSIEVTRIRGTHKQSDLYWTEGSIQTPVRGKDLGETQQLLNRRMGCDFDLYLLGAYSCEFSPAGSFFMAKAKERRELFERLADLGFCVQLLERCRELRTEVKARLGSMDSSVRGLAGAGQHCRTALEYATGSRDTWKEKQEALVKKLEAKQKTFEEDRQKEIEQIAKKVVALNSIIKDPSYFISQSVELTRAIDELASTRCITCGAPTAAQEELDLSAKRAKVREDGLKNKYSIANRNQLIEKIKELETWDPSVGEYLKEERAKENPFDSQVARMSSELLVKEQELEVATAALNEETRKFNALNQLIDLSEQVRTVLLNQAAQNLEHDTNALLEKYFDAAFRVQFTPESDSIDVNITKDGNECVYRQLSKGQRQVLRLCFSVAVMAAASNASGINFEVRFLDEALDGMDTSLKLKAYALFEELSLSAPSVLVIEHAEDFKTMFSKQFLVTNTSGESLIEENT